MNVTRTMFAGAKGSQRYVDNKWLHVDKYLDMIKPYNITVMCLKGIITLNVCRHI